MLVVFNRPERLTACACERSSDVTLVQPLHLLGSDPNTQKIRHPDGRLKRLLTSKKTDAQIVDEMMLTALSRLPKHTERQAFTAHLERKLLQANGRAEAFEDLMWALMNTKEFIFNH